MRIDGCGSVCMYARASTEVRGEVGASKFAEARRCEVDRTGSYKGWGGVGVWVEVECGCVRVRECGWAGLGWAG